MRRWINGSGNIELNIPDEIVMACAHSGDNTEDVKRCVAHKDMFGIEKVIKGNHNTDSDVLPGIYIWDKENFLEGHDPDVVFMTTSGGLIGLYGCVENTMSSSELFARENLGKRLEISPGQEAIVVGFNNSEKSIIVAIPDCGWTELSKGDILLIETEWNTYLYVE